MSEPVPAMRPPPWEEVYVPAGIHAPLMRKPAMVCAEEIESAPPSSIRLREAPSASLRVSVSVPLPDLTTLSEPVIRPE